MLQVVAVAARSQDKAQAFADKFGIPKAYAGYQALAADPNVEVVYVGVINPVHLEAVKIIAQGGTRIEGFEIFILIRVMYKFQGSISSVKSLLA